MAVFLGLGVIVPFLNHYRLAPSGSFHSEVAAASFFLMAVLASVPSLPREAVRLDRLMAAAIFGLAGLIAGHWAFAASDYAFAYASWLMLLGLFYVAFVWGQVIGRDEELRNLILLRLSWAVVIAAGANAVAQLIQISAHASAFAPYVITSNIEGSCRISGNVNQANHANTLAWMGLCAVTFLFSQRKTGCTVLVLVFTLFLVSSALTTSRTAWLFAGVISALIFFSFARTEYARKKRWPLIISVIGGLFAASLVGSQLLGEHCASAGGRFLSAREHSYNAQRADLARQAVEIWRAAPFFGEGPGRFRGASFELPIDDVQSRAVDYYAHSIFLQFLAELGALGLGILVVGLLAYAKRLANCRDKSPAFWLAISWIALVGVHSLVENAFAYAFFLIPSGIALGAALALGRAPIEGPRFRPRWGAAVAGVFGISTAVALVFDYDNLTHLDTTANIALNLGAHESPLASKRLSELREEIWLFSPYADITLLGLKSASADNVDGIRVMTARINRIFPTVETVYYSVLVATLDGDLELAAQLLRRMRLSFPDRSAEYIDKLYRVSSEHREFSALRGLVAPVAAAQR